MFLRFIALVFFILINNGLCLSNITLAHEELSISVIKTMEVSFDFYRSISSGGGYAGIYSLDLKDRFRERTTEKSRIPSTKIWVQPPGTPSVGLAFIRAYKITGEKQYLNAAIDVGMSLAWGQCSEGGWGYMADIARLGEVISTRKARDCECTFDDNTTQGALDFLIDLDGLIDEVWLSQAVENGINFVLKAQYPNGAWPQWYPLKGGLHDYYTFNDKAINDCIKVMLKSHNVYKYNKCLNSAKLGCDFMILSQLPAPQSGWAQQYSHDLKPARARSFEPAGVCSLVTVRNIDTLLDVSISTCDKKYLMPISRALSWLEKSKLPSGKWARLYEVGTNKPIYGDRSGRVYYDLKELPEDVKSYGWQGTFGVTKVKDRYEKMRGFGLEAYLKEEAVKRVNRNTEKTVKRVKKIINSLDNKGRWLHNDMIYIRDFVKNFNLLCGFLESIREEPEYEFLFSYCSLLISNNKDRSYLQTKDNNAFHSYDKVKWFKKYDLPLGEVVSQKYFDNDCIFIDYENAKIVVNPTETFRKITVGQDKLRLDWTSKKAVKELLLPPRSGRLLLATPYKAHPE